MAWRVEEIVDRRGLDHLARIHHIDAVAELRDDAEVMGDDEDAAVVVAAELAHQMHDLGFHGDVESRRRLVGDEEARD